MGAAIVAVLTITAVTAVRSDSIVGAPQVNRTVLEVTAPHPLAFSTPPTDADLRRARVFEEPLVPIRGVTSAAENTALASAIQTYAASGDRDGVGPFLQFLSRYPQSAWRPALELGLGLVYRHLGYYTRATAALQAAWDDAAGDGTPSGRAVADRAVSELMELSVELGQLARADRLVQQISTRSIGGRAGARLKSAAGTLAAWHAGRGHLTPTTAITVRLLRAAVTGAAETASEGDEASLATLADVRGLAARAGLTLVTITRARADASVPVPSIAHYRSGHTVAILKRTNARYLIADDIGGRRWISTEALDAESSGIFMTTAPAAPDGFTLTDPATVPVTSGAVCTYAPEEPPPPGPSCPLRGGGSSGGGSSPGGGSPPCGARSCGMATYSFRQVQASLLVEDEPVGYTPPVGPRIGFHATYNQRESVQPEMPSYGNLGPMWTFDWLSFVIDAPEAPDIQAPEVYLPGGELESYTTYNPTTHTAGPGERLKDSLVRTSDAPVRYERRLRDGSVEVFATADQAIAWPRRVFLSESTDPHGNTIHFTYDAMLRLVAVTDAIGQVTTLAYERAADPWKITTVTDPFGRAATFQYDASGRLATITDVLGLRSQFTYGPFDFLSSLTTPYGTTTFRHESDWLHNESDRWIEAMDPLGGRERLQYRFETPTMAETAPADEVPTGFAIANAALHQRNTFYWDQRAMAQPVVDETTAVITHWLLNEYGKRVSAVPHSRKRPREHRVWYAYPDQPYGMMQMGSWVQPTTTARTLDDGTSQITQADYNAQGNVTRRVDPLGRTTTSTYAANGIDLLEVRQTGNGVNDRLALYAGYTAQHLPASMTDAAGQTTSFTYTTMGQPLTVTNAKGETTTYGYDADGRLETITRPATGATTTYSYDTAGRVRTVTDSDGYAVTTDYDVFDRPTTISYPDATAERLIYDRLDLGQRIDRAGRVTRYWHDALRRLTATRDPLGRTVTQAGDAVALDTLIDASGHTTRWERDLQGRVTREVRADGVTATVYTYEATTSRLKTVTDPKQQVTTYTYNGDDTVQAIAFTNAQIPTPGVSYTYDAAYNRVTSMVDGTGTTVYAYHPAGVLGAEQVASVDGPLTDDTITYSYDELARVVGRAINGVPATNTYDALGRVTTETNVLGTFTYGYDGTTGRLASVAYPNGQTSAYAYLNHAGDHRLQTIHHKYPNGSTLSKFDYTYDAVGNIRTWRQQAEETAAVWEYGYDAADQLSAAVKKATDPQQTVLQRFAYGYDPAGNRLTEQIDDAVTSWTYDALNRLVTQQGGGLVQIKGVVNEPATVTVNGQSATVTPDLHFAGSATLAAGRTPVTIAATDASGNATTATYEVDQAAANKTFTFDANGNLTADGTRTFEWDAQNQLAAINDGTHRSEFTYDGQHRRVRIIERENGIVVRDQPFIWGGDEPIQRRDATSATVDLFRYGSFQGSVAAYRTHDQLGSTRDVTDATAAVQARYEYDPFGRSTTVVANTSDPLTFTGVIAHEESQLQLMTRRAYDPTLGRWLSEDPLGMKDGPNLYAYVLNDPTRWVDPQGTFLFHPFLPNGNISDNFRSQNGVCDVPGFMGWDGKSCVTKCCKEHDDCYDKSRCNWSSWLTIAYDTACGKCNRTAFTCVVGALPLPPDACQSCKAK